MGLLQTRTATALGAPVMMKGPAVVGPAPARREPVSRDQLQAEAVATLLRDRRLIVNWGTGTGKSRVAIQSVVRLLSEGKNRILLLVQETNHKGNWFREFTDCLGEAAGSDVFCSLTVECYASLPKYEGTAWDFIIADEGHHLRSDNRTGVLATMRADYFLLLSATVSDRGDADVMLNTLEMTFGLFRKLDFSLQDSIDNGILSIPKIYVHLLPLERLSEPQVITVEWGNPFARKHHEGSCSFEEYEYMNANRDRWGTARLHVTCTPKQGYDTLTQFVDAAKRRCDDAQQRLVRAQRGGDPATVKKAAMAATMAKNEWLQFGLRRRNLLGACKTLYAQWLLKQLGNKKYVCFCSDVEHGKILGGDNIIYADRKDNAQVIKAFDEDRIRSIFAIGMIQEGQNLRGIEAGVIVQLGGKERVFIQKFGRAMRSKMPEQHIIVVNDTRDVTYYRNAVANINPQYIRLIRVGERTDVGRTG